MSGFDKLNLKKDVLAVLAKLKFKEPFEVQKQILPIVLKGQNVVFTSMTGSGKTLAYTIGFLSKFNKKLGAQMLVLVPTRELAIQVGKEIKKFTDLLDLNVGVLYGGRDIKGDYKTIQRKNQIIVGTPGRLIMHINEKALKVGDVKFLIFDESDQMFDQGFSEMCSYVKKRCSSDAQIVLASATITPKVERFVRKEIPDFEFLQIGNLVPTNILQEKLYCKNVYKTKAVVNFFHGKKFKRAIVFANTKVKVNDLADFLRIKNINSASLTSNLEQQERNDRLNLFKEGKIKVLVATDVAARGLHIDNVDFVINYDIPTKEEFYVHRIGRTGRTRKKGYSLSLICPEDEERFDNIVFEYELDISEVDSNFRKI